MNLAINRSFPFSLHKEIFPQTSSNLLTRVAIVALFALGLLIAYFIYTQRNPNSPKIAKSQPFTRTSFSNSSQHLKSPSTETPQKRQPQAQFDDERMVADLKNSIEESAIPESKLDDDGFDPVELEEVKKLSLEQNQQQKST